MLSTEGPLHVIAHNPKTGSGSKECGVGTRSLPDCECSAPKVPCWHHLQLSTGAGQSLDLIKHSPSVLTQLHEVSRGMSQSCLWQRQ